MSRATSDQFDALHGLLCGAMKDQLVAYANMKDEAGHALPIPPAFLAQCLKFLKDNGIDSPARAVKVLDTLKDKLPDFEFGFEHGAPN